MRPRLRRLTADHEEVQRVFDSHPYISLRNAEGDPPDRYSFELIVPGLAPGRDVEPCEVRLHRVEVILLLEYPRRPPFCRMLTPVFHPNIDAAKICIGDHWSAGQSLAQLVVRIAEMIAFQSYNVQSPLNGEAAAWAEQNMAKLPLLKEDLAAGL
ncbi:ubiquitin-conjugating enzyme E2 [Verrucomicrobiota bacterium]